MPFIVDHLGVLIKRRHSIQFNIHSIADLGRQSTVKYGVIAGGATEAFFRNSRLASYARMWTAMARDGNASRVRSQDEGIERVFASTDERPYAFLTESSALKYSSRHRCDVEVFVDEFGLRCMSLAVPLESQYLHRLSFVILEMSENGDLHALRTKWWHERTCSLSANACLHCTKLLALHLSTLVIFVVRLLQRC